FSRSAPTTIDGNGRAHLRMPDRALTTVTSLGGWRIRRSLAIAAAITLLIGVPALVWLWNGSNPLKPYQPLIISKIDPNAPRARPLDEVYRKQVASGMVADWICKDQEEFCGYFQTRLGQKLKMHDPPAGAKLLGLSFTGGLSPRTV